MFRRIFAAVLVFAQAVYPAAAYKIADGQYYYRYKTGVASSQSDDTQSKDITAYYIAGVGEAFSEKLPMKPQWEDDNWEVVGGSLPSGISFNPSTLTFEGKATTVSSNIVADLKGFDANRNEVATASATFNVYQLPDQVVTVNFYHHTNQYGSDALNLPSGVTIDGDPTLLTPLPPGVTFNARYFDGTPTKSGVYPVLAFGYDYTKTKAIVAFKGKYTVEDGPVFAKVPDDLRKLEADRDWGCQTNTECAVWSKETTQKIRTPLKTASDVKYYVEVQPGSTLPGTLSFGSDPSKREKNGRTYTAFDQATIRYKAVDIDNIPGYSNWFKIGSLGHTELCKPNPGDQSITLPGTVGSVLAGSVAGYVIPVGRDTSQRTYSLTGGTLPDGVEFDTIKGAFTGMPEKLGNKTGIMVTISYPSDPGSTPTICGPYDFQIAPSPLTLGYSGLKPDYRVGEAVDVTLAARGNTVPPYKIEMASDAVLPSGISYDSTAHHLSGIASEKGDFSATFKLTNGDNLTYRTGFAFSIHDPVKVNPVPGVSAIKRYDVADPLFKVTYDRATVIGSETWSLKGGALPDGFTFDRGSLTVQGGTCLPVDKYGPFSIELKDSTGQSDKTNDFYIDVTERDELVRGTTTDPVTLAVNLYEQGQKPFSVAQQTLAQTCLPPLQYALSPATLPDGLVFSETTGRISGTPAGKSTTGPYTVKIEEVSSYNYSATSDPFSIVVNDPPPINDQGLTKLEGNVGATTRIASVNPTSVLRAIRNDLVGYEQAVVFDNASPTVPGLTFNPATGVLEGVPTEEFDGTITITYHDGGNRNGKLLLPVTIYPFPTLTSDKTAYELPRLSDAADYGIAVNPGNTGFYKGVTYTLGPNSAALPSGLRLSDNSVNGNTSSLRDQTYNIVIRGTSKADSSIHVDYPITLKVVEEQLMKLDLKPDDNLVWKIDENSRQLVPPSDKFSSTKPTGSYVKPYSYSLVDGPDWMTIDANGQLGGTPPSLGERVVTIQVEDAEQHKATDTATVKVTLSGFVQMSPGGSDGTITVRQGESFKTEPQLVTNAVAPFDFTVKGNKPSSVALDPATGVFLGRIDASGNWTWTLDALDADQRTTENPYPFAVKTVPPVELPAPVSATSGKQYDPAKPITIVFAPAENIIGKATYEVTGPVPGSVYYKYYDEDDPSKLATYISETGEVVRQAPNEDTLTTEYYRLPPDHMVFDTLSLTMTGIPSSFGTFQIGLTVYDDHEKNGYTVDPSDPTRADYNEKQSSTVTVNVAKADDLLVANSADQETLHQYTSQPTLTSSVSNDAYGRGASWTKVAGTGNLPNKVFEYPKTLQTLAYYGYPDTQGTWDNIQWTATDAAGRKVVTNPVSFTVGPRQAMELVASSTLPRGMVVFEGDANLTVSARFAANGETIGKSNWSISGTDKLPPGVVPTITDDGVHFAGTSNKIGVYNDIIVSAVDTLGARASLSLTFKVISSSDPIVLNVSAIKTKVGFPIVMQPPFAAAALSTDNTYGPVRFYSNDLPSIQGITLNGSTGYIDGTLQTAQNLMFDLFVTDDTNRVTSKPVSVSVTPNLRVIVPTQVATEQGKSTSSAIATDYALGTVTYEKGAGNWPVGFVVDPASGKITSNYTDPATGKVTTNVVAASGTYSGLTIVGTDTFGNKDANYTDKQSSNTFSIVVTPTTAVPDIAEQPKTILGTEGTSITWAIKPISGWASGVIERNKVANAWSYAGTTYSANYDLNQYGLSFNTTTGMITGTPTAPFIIRDFVIKVKSQRGDEDSTAPFWIGVAPKDALVIDPAQKVTYVFRTDDTTWRSDAIKVLHYVGDLAFDYGTQAKAATWTFDTKTGSFAQVGAIVATTVNGMPATGWPAYINVTDEFGRKARWNGFWLVHSPLSVTAPSAGIAFNEAYTNLFTPVVAGLYGTKTIKMTGLPQGLDYDPATGTVTGKMDTDLYNYGTQDTWPINVEVTDSGDGAKKTADGSFKLVKGGSRYFRILDAGSYTYWGCAWFDLYDEFGNVSNYLSPTPYGNTRQGVNRVTLQSKVLDGCQVGRWPGVGYTLMWDFGKEINITSVVARYDNSWNAGNSVIRAPQFQVSKDNVTWTTVWTGTTSGGAMTKVYAKP